MVILAILPVLAVLTILLFRYLRARCDAGTLWRSSVTIGCVIGVTRAVLACAGWYGVEHTGGPVQIPAYALALLALPEAMVFGRHRGPVPLQSYLFLALLLVGTSVLLVGVVALAVQATCTRLATGHPGEDQRKR